jgi:L-threonylcarbamoyladenylate synthase
MQQHFNQQPDIDLAISVLQQGKVIVFPTDTVYGLGGDPRSESAIHAVFKLKNRCYNTALPILIPSLEHLSHWIDPKYLTKKLLALAAEFWPGSLTIVVKKAQHVSDLLTAGQDTIALRVPNQPLMLDLLQQFNSAIIGTSANKSGEPSLTNYQQAKQVFGDQEVLIIDGGQCNFGVESTIVSLVDDLKILRTGAISRAKLVKYL